MWGRVTPATRVPSSGTGERVALTCSGALSQAARPTFGAVELDQEQMQEKQPGQSWPTHRASLPRWLSTPTPLVACKPHALPCSLLTAGGRMFPPPCVHFNPASDAPHRAGFQRASQT